jgi:hypothetical protein
MEKIIKVALLSKFGAETLPSVMEVINATPNPTMATEILLGIYEQPEIPETTVYNNTVRTLKSVDYWLDQVNYTYESEETKGFYIHKDTDSDLVTIDNYKEFMIDRSKYPDSAIWISIPTGKISMSSNYCRIDSWLKYKGE